MQLIRYIARIEREREREGARERVRTLEADGVEIRVSAQGLKSRRESVDVRVIFIGISVWVANGFGNWEVGIGIGIPVFQTSVWEK